MDRSTVTLTIKINVNSDRDAQTARGRFVQVAELISGRAMFALRTDPTAPTGPPLYGAAPQYVGWPVSSVTIGEYEPRPDEE